MNDVRLRNLKRGGTSETAAKARAANIRKADARAADVMLYIAKARSAGCRTLQQIADALNNQGVATPFGRKWHPTSVMRVIERVDRSAAA
jgi:Recombinase